jgi:hypothetical protein
MLHSVAYFLADLVCDRDPDYVLHHLAPIAHSEMLLRSGAASCWTFARAACTDVGCSFRAGAKLGYSRLFLGTAEAGNIIAHSFSLITLRSGPLFHKVRCLSHCTALRIKSFVCTAGQHGLLLGLAAALLLLCV